MIDAASNQLIEQARAILDANWMGRSTKPAPRLYPHQWSWDSAFIALAYAHYDQPRAETELRSLFAAQWKNGLVPHIVFNPKAISYAPSPEMWRTTTSPHAPLEPRTSGIVQPPVHASTALHIFRHAQDKESGRAFLAELFPRLQSWHAYLHRERDPLGEGLVYIRHPWESGQDNSPLWDRCLQRIQPRPDQIPAYQRVDTTIIDSDQRPTKDEYDRYMYLVKLFADRDYDEARLSADGPFRIQDVLFNTLLCQANRDLAVIAQLLGEDATCFAAWAEQTASAMNAKCWDAAHGIYLNIDLVAGTRIPVHVAAGFAPLYAGIPNPDQAQQIYAYLNSPAFRPLETLRYPVPSYRRDAPDYSPSRYWRGPVWINLNWLLYHGLSRYGFDAYAAQLRQAIIQLPAEHGFYEYFNPETGQGYGSDQFSWTAALVMDLLFHPSAPAAERDSLRGTPIT